jgi:hypothetical protein
VRLGSRQVLSRHGYGSEPTIEIWRERRGRTPICAGSFSLVFAVGGGDAGPGGVLETGESMKRIKLFERDGAVFSIVIVAAHSGHS